MQSERPELPRQRRNPLTQREHNRQVLWQIALPLAVGVLLALAAAGGVIWTGTVDAGAVSQWADAALIWLSLPLMLVCALFLALLAGLAYGLTVAVQRLPFFTYRVQNFFRLASLRVRKVADGAVEPVMRAQGLAAAWKALWRRR